MASAQVKPKEDVNTKTTLAGRAAVSQQQKKSVAAKARQNRKIAD